VGGDRNLENGGRSVRLTDPPSDEPKSKPGMEAKITKKVDIHPRYSHLHPDIEVAVEANPVDTWAKCSVLPIPSSTAYSGKYDGP